MSNKIWNNFQLPKDVEKINITVPSRVPDENHVSVSPSSVSRSKEEAPVYDMIHKIIQTLTNGLVITFDNKSYGLYEMHTPTKKGGRTRKHHNKKTKHSKALKLIRKSSSRMRSLRSRTRKKSCCCVGILTIPHARKSKYGTSHIMKSYIDWFEHRGIRVLPIPFDTKDHEVYFQMVNGLFLPGTDRGFDYVSSVQNEIFMQSLRTFYEMSMRKGEYFPIWGTCFGMERLIELIGGSRTWKSFPADGLFPIRISRDTTRSKMIQSFPSPYLDYLEQEKSTLQYHEYGISVEEMKTNPLLRRYFSVLATSLDESGKEYVAAIESKHYPIYAVQFHPEQQRSTTPFLDFFRSELKMNSHRCPMLPRVGKVISAHKCAHYEGLKHQMCYFFN